MTTASHPINVAVLDDYQGVALSIVDWSKVSNRANLTVFQDRLADQHAVAERLKPFDVVCIMRERTPMPASLLERLPRLKLIASTGSRNSSIELLGISVDGSWCHAAFGRDRKLHFPRLGTVAPAQLTTAQASPLQAWIVR